MSKGVIRVCHLITALDAGGAQRNLVNLVARPGSDRIVNDVVSMVEPGMMAAELRAAGIAVTSLGMRRGRASLKGMASLVQHLRRTRPTILLTWLYHADLIGYFASRFARNTQLVWNLRCSDIADDPKESMLRAMLHVLARLSARPSLVVVNSKAGRLFHQKWGYRPKAWAEIGNGVDAHRFRPRPTERAELRARLGLSADARVIGLVARQHPMKDHRTFLEAAAIFAQHEPGARFVLCGEGCEPFSKLKTLVGTLNLSDRALLLGAQTAMEDIYPTFDVLAMSSAYGEGFPTVLIEAMACGVPCVATDVGDSKDIVSDTGMIVPIRDPQALATGWQDILAHEPGLLGRNARWRIDELYSVESARERYLALYEALAQGGSFE
jgi:glycosyltransferase involved in cell wall biosynthesis